MTSDLDRTRKNIIDTQKDLSIKRVEAETANESKTEFLATMSHEIRTPMNGVIGMTNLLLDSGLNQDQRKLARTVKSSAESLLCIINDILDFSKVESGMLELEEIDFNLGQMIEDLGSSMHCLADTKNIELVCPASPLLNQWVNGDPGRLRQILTNLVSNAIKFTQLGEVAVYIFVDNSTAGQKHLRFEVKDSGIGIAPEKQDALFSKFTQADSSTTRHYGGTGLGLSIAKNLVELMGGEIGVNSQLGKGSTFWFNIELPSVEIDDEQMPLNVDVDLHLQNVLVVDDNATNRELMHQLLNAWEIPHSVSHSGANALHLLNDAVSTRSPYTLAIIDMQMPDMDGVELCGIIKRSSSLQDTSLIMLTSQAKRGDAKKMEAAGFSGYLTKPINQLDLYHVVQQVSGLPAQDPVFVTRYSGDQEVQFNSRVLIVEDNGTNQAVIKGMLEKFGITTDIANDGEDALKAMSRQGASYDLIIMDCQMPIMDGYTATQRIRAPNSNIPNRFLPIIAMTANAMAGDKEKCLSSGMDDYIAKPVDPAKLRRMLEQWLPAAAKHNITSGDPAETSTTEVISEPDKAQTKHSNLPVFDYSQLKAQLSNDETLLKSILETFTNDMTKQLANLDEAIDTQNFELTASISHQIKGASASVGGQQMSQLAGDMELEAKTKNENFETLSVSNDALKESFKTLQIEISHKLIQ